MRALLRDFRLTNEEIYFSVIIYEVFKKLLLYLCFLTEQIACIIF